MLVELVARPHRHEMMQYAMFILEDTWFVETQSALQKHAYIVLTHLNLTFTQ